MEGSKAPRKPKSAYWIFAGEFLEKNQKQSSNEKQAIRQKLCGKAYQALSKDELEKFKKMAHDQQEEYEKALKDYYEKYPIESQQNELTEEIQIQKLQKNEKNGMNRIRTRKRQQLEEEISRNDSVNQMNSQGTIIKKRSEIAKQNLQKMIISEKKFPNESDEYREKRKDLLQAEIDLMTHIEEVSKKRRNLPKGGKLKTNYSFTEMVYSHPVNTEFRSIFEQGKNILIIYSLIFDEEDSKPCQYSHFMIDSWNGLAKHIQDKVNFVVVSNADIEKLTSLAEEKQWGNIRFLSCQDTTYNKDYFGEDIQTHGTQHLPMLNVFEKDDDGEIYHFWGSEMSYVRQQNEEKLPIDKIWPLWNILDFSRDGSDKELLKIDYQK